MQRKGRSELTRLEAAQTPARASDHRGTVLCKSINCSAQSRCPFKCKFHICKQTKLYTKLKRPKKRILCFNDRDREKVNAPKWTDRVSTVVVRTERVRELGKLTRLLSLLYSQWRPLCEEIIKFKSILLIDR